jgi:hypothetical protein
MDHAKIDRVIFLDCDGVLNAPGWWEMFWWNLCWKLKIKLKGRGIVALERKFVRRLDRIVRATKARIVISSSWRSSFPDPYQWRQIFTSMGFPTSGAAVIGVLPPHEPGVKRGDEIEVYLQAMEHRPTRVCILDDDRDFTLDQQIVSLVQVQGRHGLRGRDVRTAIHILRGGRA